VTVPAIPHTPVPWLRAARGRRLAVLGADGYLGSHVVRSALAAGASVVAVCVKSPWRLADVEAELRRVPGGSWWTSQGRAAALDASAGSDAAAVLLYTPPPSVGDFAYRLDHERAVNSASIASIATALAAAGTRVVFSSSADVYGAWHDEAITEEATPVAATPYAMAKLEAERQVLGLADSLVLRIATAYGAGENGPRAIPSFTRALLTGNRPTVDGVGTDQRDYVHAADVAGAIVNAAFAQSIPERVLNIGSGVGRTALDALGAVAKALSVADPDPEFRAARRAPSRLILDCSAAERALGLRGGRDFEAAVAEEVAWLTSHLQGASLDPGRC
jgi:UDP-glucose 4-epimerase